MGFVPYGVLRGLGDHGVGLCVDLGHLYAEVMADGTQGEECFSRVVAATRELAPYARHLHLSTTVAPWNGTDSHNGFLEADYAQGAVPTGEQTVSWLRLFDGRDAWVIPEPYGGGAVHLANCTVLCRWMERIG